MPAIKRLETVNPRKIFWVIIVSSAIPYITPIPRKKVATMAIPPAVGVGLECEDRKFGASIIREQRMIFKQIILENKNRPKANKMCFKNINRVMLIKKLN
jgi:hypothetical protein